MKITFVHSISESVGLEYLSAALKKNGHSTELFFDPCLFNDNLLKINFLNKIFNFNDQIIKNTIKSKADLIVFSLLSDNYPWFKKIATQIKKMIDVPIVVGGIHASSVPDILIKEPFVDYLIVGEGDLPILQLVEFLEGKRTLQSVSNLWYKSKKTISHNPVQPLLQNLDELPFPDKDFFYEKIPFYQNHYFITASKGCFFHCHYCYHSMYKSIYPGGANYRVRSPKNIIDELLQAKKKYDIYSFYFVDDIFGADLEWLKEFSSLYKKHIAIPYSCSVHTLFITEKTVQLLKDSLCFKVELGVQTINKSLRENSCNRYESIQTIENAINLLMNNNIRVYTQNIVTLPGETEENLKEMIHFYGRVKTTTNLFFYLRYYPRTKIVSMALDYNLIDNSHVQQIEHGEIFGALGTGGSLSNKITAKYYFLLSMSKVLPYSFSKYIISKNRIQYIPTFILKRFTFLLLFIANRGKEFFYPWEFKKLFRFNRDISRYKTFLIKKLLNKPIN